MRWSLSTSGQLARLVAPVRGDSDLGRLVHLPGADLDLDRAPVGADHRGVQRLVHVGLGGGDVVLEAVGDRHVQAVHEAEGGVAVAHRLDEDAHGAEVVDLLEGRSLGPHLVVDAVEVLRPAGDLRVDPGLGEVGLDRGLELLDVDLALLPFHRHLAADFVVLIRVEVLEAEVLELPADAGEAEPVGQRGVHVDGFAGNPFLLLGLDVVEGAHVVQPVGELDEDHPQVLDHRQQHLAVGFGLAGFAALVLEALDLGHAVGQGGDLGAELGGDLLQGHRGVLEHVVQQSGGYRGRVETELREDAGDLDAVLHERPPRHAGSGRRACRLPSRRRARSGRSPPAR